MKWLLKFIWFLQLSAPNTRNVSTACVTLNVFPSTRGERSRSSYSFPVLWKETFFKLTGKKLFVKWPLVYEIALWATSSVTYNMFQKTAWNVEKGLKTRKVFSNCDLEKQRKKLFIMIKWRTESSMLLIQHKFSLRLTYI